MTAGSFTAQTKEPTEVGLILSHRKWETGTLSRHLYLREMVLRSLRQVFLGQTVDKRPISHSEDLYTFQRKHMFYKVNATLRKRRNSLPLV